MTTEEKFNAAVNVIRSLPKNGSYQPSNDLMLRFYAYFKQATLGPCSGKRPPFYDVVGRAKYDAWKGLGDMTKQHAMKKYVDELHTIVETMSYSDKVANFLEAPTEEIDCVNKIMDDLELIAGDVLENVRSRPNSPLASREASPIRMLSSRETSPPVSTPSSAPEDSDRSDDEYTDTIEYPDTKKIYSEQNGYIPKEHVSRSRTKPSQQNLTPDVSQEISRAVQSLKADVERLNSRIHSLEKTNVAVRKNKGMKLHLIAFIIAWPFLASFIMNRFVLTRNK